MATSKTAKGSKKEQKQETKRGRKPKPANAPFSISDPLAMLKQHPEETKETLQAIAEDKTIKRSDFRTTLYARLALRLAEIGLCTVDTKARNAAERTYKANSKTNMKALAAALKRTQAPAAAQ